MKSRMIPVGLAALVLTGCAVPVETGQSRFLDHCAVCHGEDAKGGRDAPLAKVWPKPPADLTTLAARNDGVFPTEYVMSTIDGYLRAKTHGTTMPQFGGLLDGPAMVWTDSNGVATPTPVALVELAGYLESIQG